MGECYVNRVNSDIPIKFLNLYALKDVAIHTPYLFDGLNY